MSRTEHHIGKLIPTGLTFSQFVEREGVRDLLEELGGESCELMSNKYDGYGDNDHYMILNGFIYQVENKELDADCGLEIANVNSDGSFSYHVMFYNGGCGMEEAIEDAINKL